MAHPLRPLTLGTCTTYLVLALLAAPSAAGEPQTGSKPTELSSEEKAASGESQRPVPDSSGAVRIYRDPATGRLVPPPRGTPAPPERPQSSSDRGLKETPSSVPGGGVQVDLQGRFQNPLVATPGDDGKPKIKHSAPIPE